ncbi:hypothetical protein ACTFIV_001500 [Dictyostelium citrinum]
MIHINDFYSNNISLKLLYQYDNSHQEENNEDIFDVKEVVILSKDNQSTNTTTDEPPGSIKFKFSSSYDLQQQTQQPQQYYYLKVGSCFCTSTKLSATRPIFVVTSQTKSFSKNVQNTKAILLPQQTIVIPLPIETTSLITV